MTETKPPSLIELIWSEQQRFGAVAGANALVVDGNGVAGPSPVQLLALALAGCMATDVVLILQKGRHPLEGLTVALTGDRASDDPRRFLRITLDFHVRGSVPHEAVQRAISLSRDKYCSVWHSLRQDIELTTTFDIGQ